MPAAPVARRSHGCRTSSGDSPGGAALGLQVSDLDLADRFFYVRRNVYRGHVQSAPKTPAGERWVPIASSVIPALEAWLHVRSDDSEWLFPNEAGKPYYERNLLRRKLWPVCDRLGIPRFGWHSLRHTFSTYGGNSGVPLPVLQYLLGHANVETTMLYTHPLAEAQRIGCGENGFDFAPRCSLVG